MAIETLEKGSKTADLKASASVPEDASATLMSSDGR